ncbi:ECF transporter S component [uncultured Clostridium sp.]|uniref:ECF transporter S component n=1 Tax=uncultured Clostridium sp. TaxID=59620 RepID=UPI0028EC62F0|nr:ECF transporter S component [uncultured Clostridium sp.]
MKDSKKLVRTALLLAISIGVQALGRSYPQISQIFVGSIVNAALIISVFSSGIYWAVLLGALTPMLAWIIGQLPGPMGPFVPFIIIGNAIFTISFGLLKGNKDISNYIFLLISAVLKFLFLSLSAKKLIYLFNLGLPEKVAEKLGIMMGVPQLITALIGGFLGILIVKILIKNKAI